MNVGMSFGFKESELPGVGGTYFYLENEWHKRCGMRLIKFFSGCPADEIRSRAGLVITFLWFKVGVNVRNRERERETCFLKLGSVRANRTNRTIR